MARSADHFVLFADVIASRQIDPKALAAGLKALLNHLRQRRRACFVLPPMRSLGDELQMMPVSLAEGLRVMLEMEEFFLARPAEVGFRYVLTYGAVNGVAADAEMTSLTGPALIRARELINENKRQGDYSTQDIRRGRTWIDLPSEQAGRMIEAVFYALDMIRRGWKRDHHAMAALMIGGAGDGDIAARFDYTRAAVWKRRQRMQIHNYLKLRALLKDMTDAAIIESLIHEIKR